MTAPDAPPAYLVAIDAAGAILAAHLDDGTYVAGYEAGQAKELIEALDGADRTALLTHLVRDHFVTTIGSDGLLDETVLRSYDLAEDFAQRLLAEIAYQHREAEALYQLTVAAICTEADIVKSLADYKATRTEGATT
jgi:hypothetical protein